MNSADESPAAVARRTPAPDAQTGEAHRRPGSPPGASRARARLTAAASWLSVTIVSLAILAAALWWTRGIQQPVGLIADAAVIEVAARDALRLKQVLGPYSRFGWHHPGPSYFYFLAFFYGLFGQAPRALLLGSFLVNGLSALGTVAAVRRFLGEGLARWAAALVGAYLLAATPLMFSAVGVWGIWNPVVLALPLLLTMVLAAGAWSGSLSSLLGAAVTGSFAVQTHLGTAPVAGVALAFGAAGWLASKLGWFPRSSPGDAPAVAPAGPAAGRAWARRTPVVGLLLLLAAEWTAPAYEQLTQRPGNFTRLIAFFRGKDRPPDELRRHSALKQALPAIARYATIVPLGDETPFDTALVLDEAPVEWPRMVALFVEFALAGVAAIGGWRRRRPVIAALGGLSALGLVVAVLAVSRVTGHIMVYLLWWTGTLPIPGLIATLALAADVLGARPWAGVRARRAVGTIGVLAATLPNLLFANTVLRTAPAPEEPRGRLLADKVLEALGPTRDVTVNVDSQGWGWFIGLPVFNELQRHGVRVTGFMLFTPPPYAATGREDVLVRITPTGEAPIDPLLHGAVRVGRVPEFDVWLLDRRHPAPTPAPAAPHD